VTSRHYHETMFSSHPAISAVALQRNAPIAAVLYSDAGQFGDEAVVKINRQYTITLSASVHSGIQSSFSSRNQAGLQTH
jgi:hypothetical protein